jgi:sialate O-acetylesterase
MKNKMLSTFKVFLSVLILFGFVITAAAEVRLPHILTSDMVLQRNAELKIWGWADKAEKVTVTFNHLTLTARATSEGKWSIVFPAMKEGGPYEMLVTDKKNAIRLENILIGDVWVLSGQSNMVVSVAKSLNPEEEIKNADYPGIRLLRIPNRASLNPVEDVDSTEWKVCTPENIPGFSGVGYFFGRKIHMETGVPIGLIQSAWGGTFAEPWTAEDCLEKYPEIRDQIRTLRASPGIPADKDVSSENALVKDNPAQLFNGMIYPLLNLKITGVLWYQGEKNSQRPATYKEVFPNLIHCWRKYWERPDLPFLYVQLANWRQPSETPQDHAWSEIREAQLMTLSLPYTGMAVAIDLGEAEDIHPKNKQDVGYRLALNALKIAYGRDIVFQGPLYKSMEIQGDRVILDFDHKGSGLVAKDKYGYLKGFSMAGSDGKFYWARAMIKDNKVVVYSPEVPSPVEVRYAWAHNPDDANLYNKEGLPASPFRTLPFGDKSEINPR